MSGVLGPVLSDESHELNPLPDAPCIQSGSPSKMASPNVQSIPAFTREAKLSNKDWPELPNAWHPPDLSDYWKAEVRSQFTNEDKKKAWGEVTNAVKTYSDEMVKRWINEMDSLLVFAGLFSTVLTAFNVQSYTMLTPSAPDPILDALQAISVQLSSFSLNPPFVNSTSSAWQERASQSNGLPEQWVVWLNAAWFSSLICSLSSASMAIMVKQWLNQYKSGISGESHQTGRLRQYRLNGLLKWHVGAVISILPLLVQISLGLFFSGLLILLWNLNHKVALAASTLVGVLALFVLVTTVLPICSSDCAYRSPLPFSLFYLTYPLRYIRYGLFYAFAWLWKVSPAGARIEAVAFRLCTLLKTQRPRLTLHDVEKRSVRQSSPQLDKDILAMAYSTTVDLGSLNSATAACFTDMDTCEVFEILSLINMKNQENRGGTNWGLSEHWTQDLPLGTIFIVLLARIQSRPWDLDLTSESDYLAISPVDDRVAADQLIPIMSSIVVILWNYYDGLKEAGNLARLIDCLHSVICRLKLEPATLNKITTGQWLSVAACAYKITRDFSQGMAERTRDWDILYPMCLYILIECTQAMHKNSQSVCEDKNATNTLQDAISFAQNKITAYIEKQPKTDSPDTSIIGRIKWSELEKVDGGISSGMLNAMVNYANSGSNKSYQWPWLEELKRKRDRATKNMTPIPHAVTTPALYSGMPAIHEKAHSGSTLPVIRKPLPMTSAIDADASESEVLRPSTDPYTASRTTANYLPTLESSEAPLATPSVARPIPQSYAHRADPPKAEARSAESPRAEPPTADEDEDREGTIDLRPQDEPGHGPSRWTQLSQRYTKRKQSLGAPLRPILSRLASHRALTRETAQTGSPNVAEIQEVEREE